MRLLPVTFLALCVSCEPAMPQSSDDEFAGEGEGEGEGEDVDVGPLPVLPLWVLTHPSEGEARISEVVTDEGFVRQSFEVPPAISSPHGLAVDSLRNRLLVIGFGDEDAAGLWTIDLDTGTAAPLNPRLQGSGVVVQDGRIFVVAEERFVEGENRFSFPLSLHEVDPVSGTIVTSREIHGMSCALDLAVIGEALVYTCDRHVVRFDEDAVETVMERQLGTDNGENIYAATRFDDTRTLFVEAHGLSWVYDGGRAIAGRPIPMPGWITAVAVP
ncbi:MAG: hypothetical protein Q8O67_32075 [Deltaproteobacteria bacterium]|nr:hypothetical protein [Deltaproteobacteria bacterium]